MNFNIIVKRYNKLYYLYLDRLGYLRLYKNGKLLLSLKNCSIEDFKELEKKYF